MSFSSYDPLVAERPALPLTSACPVPPDDRRPPHHAETAGNAALEAAFRMHAGALLRFLRGKAGADDAPDLVQEVFARAASSEQRHRLTNPGGFLRRIAQNLLIDRARRHARYPAMLLPLDEHRDSAVAPQQEWNIDALDLMGLYEAAVDAMPPKTQRVFLMHRVDELSYREIHQVLGISVATVEYHMMNALRQIERVVDSGR